MYQLVYKTIPVPQLKCHAVTVVIRLLLDTSKHKTNHP